ncbi:MAG: leucine-rich repeat domain-containing protein [Microscillaceae bacterium]|jgi:Leucine-rich repeat (LRR) protein|nr:leucine-rich repeat domain-containing protein [Microscillaceae bacterium]
MMNVNEPFNQPNNREELKRCPKIDFRQWKEHKKKSEQIYRAELSTKVPNAEVLAYFPNLMELEVKYLKFVPKEIFQFPKLKILTFYDCKIDEIYPEIGFLHDLEVLKFDICEIFLENKKRVYSFWDKILGKVNYPIYEPEPSLLNVCNLLNIRELSFRLRPIPEFPEDIIKLENLESLSFIQTDLIALPQNLSVLSRLKSIEISANSEANYAQISEVLSNCRFLEELKLNGIRNDKSPLDIDFIKKLARLKGFSARNTFVKNFEVLSSFGQLEKIDLSRPDVYAYKKGITIPPDFANLVHLRELNLAGNQNPQILAKISSKITQWQQLERLDLSNCQLKNLPEELGELTNLQYLNLAENDLTDLPHTFDYLSNLRTLNLKNCKIHPKYINRLREMLPKLQIHID